MKREYELEVHLKEIAAETTQANAKTPFSKTYKIALWDEFVSNKTPKENGFAEHVDRLAAQLKLSAVSLTRHDLKRRQIVAVNF